MQRACAQPGASTSRRTARRRCRRSCFSASSTPGAWGMTVRQRVASLRVGVAAGARRALIANQVVHDVELAALQVAACARTATCAWCSWSIRWRSSRDRGWSARTPQRAVRGAARDRRGRWPHRLFATTHDAPALARAPARQRGSRARSASECYEGLGATGDSRARHAPYASSVDAAPEPIVAQACDRESAVRVRRGHRLGRRLGHLRPRGRAHAAGPQRRRASACCARAATSRTTTAITSVRAAGQRSLRMQ